MNLARHKSFDILPTGEGMPNLNTHEQKSPVHLVDIGSGKIEKPTPNQEDESPLILTKEQRLNQPKEQNTENSSEQLTKTDLIKSVDDRIFQIANSVEEDTYFKESLQRLYDIRDAIIDSRDESPTVHANNLARYKRIFNASADKIQQKINSGSETAPSAFSDQENADVIRLGKKVKITLDRGIEKVAKITKIFSDREEKRVQVEWKEGTLKLRKIFDLKDIQAIDKDPDSRSNEGTPSKTPAVEKANSDDNALEMGGADIEEDKTIPSPIDLSLEIQNNPYLTADDRMTANSLFEQYERMKAEGKERSALDKMLLSIKDTLDVPVDAEKVIAVAESMPFLSTEERQNINSFYEQYLRLKKEGQPEAVLQQAVKNMRSVFEDPADPSRLLDRAELILHRIDYLEKTKPEEAKTARAFYDNFQNINKMFVENNYSHKHESSAPLSEDAVRQAYKNLEDFVSDIPQEDNLGYLESQPSKIASRVEALSPVKKRRFEYITSLFKTNKSKTRMGLLAGALAVGLGSPAGDKDNQTENFHINTSKTTATSEMVSESHFTDADIKNIETYIATLTKESEPSLDVEQPPTNPKASNEANILSAGIPGVSFELPQKLEVEHGEVFSTKATNIPGDRHTVLPETPAIPADEAGNLDNEPAPYKIKTGDNVWTLVSQMATEATDNNFNRLADNEKKAALSLLISEINSDPELSREANIPSNDADKIKAGNILETKPLLRVLDNISYKLLAKKGKVDEGLVDVANPAGSSAEENQLESGISNEKIITPDVIEQFIENFPGGKEEYKESFNSWINAIEGLPSDNGWFSKIFGTSHKSAFSALSTMTLEALDGLSKVSSKELQAEARRADLRIADVREWLKKVSSWKNSKNFSGIGQQTTLAELAEQAFVANKIEEDSKSNVT